MFNEWIACKMYFMARVFEGRGDALGVRWRQVGLAASSVSRKLSANCCDGRALKIWGLIEGWGVAEDKNQGKRGGYLKHDVGDHGYNQLIKTKKVLQKYFPVQGKCKCHVS